MNWKTVPADEAYPQTAGADVTSVFVARPDDGLDEMVAALRAGPKWLRHTVLAAFDTLDVCGEENSYIKSGKHMRLTLFFNEQGFLSGSLMPDDYLNESTEASE